jgi:arylformamidase
MKNDNKDGGWIDVSVPIKKSMTTWPGHPEITIDRFSDMAKESVMNLTRISMSLHTGTHMDAPLHFVKDGFPIDAIPPEAIIGPARIIEISDTEKITAEEIEKANLSKGDRVLFKTVNSERNWIDEPFFDNYVYVSTPAGKKLAEICVQTIGIDYLSVGGYKKNGIEVHNILLRAGIWLIEGLDLSKVSAGDYELVCLPLKIENAEGSPARAFLRKM